MRRLAAQGKLRWCGQQLRTPLVEKKAFFCAIDPFLINFDVFYFEGKLSIEYYFIKIWREMANLRLNSSNDLDTGSVAPQGQEGK